MASASSIPRFLLPQRGAIWQQSPQRLLQRTAERRRTPGQLRHASDSAGKGKKQIVLEKPARFNPPSHGQRLPKKGAIPRHYGGDLSQAEKAAQEVRDYPNMMAPKGTTQHWFIHSHKLHVFLTLGTLSGLALFVFIVNFKATSPYADMVPEWGDFFSSPIQSLRTLGAVVRMHEEHRSAEVAEKRKRRVEDVAKRDEYRKAHGLDTQTAWGAWSAKMSEKLEGKQAEDAEDVPRPTSARKEREIDEEAVLEAAKKKSWLRLWM